MFADGRSSRTRSYDPAVNPRAGRRSARNRRSSSDPAAEIARLILRGALGGTFIAHSVRHGKTLDGTAGWFGSIGFRQPKLQAALSSAVEVGAGAAVAVGAHGYFITSEGWEYAAVLSAAAVALSALGSGRWSVDRLLGLDKIGSPATRAVLSAGLGTAGAAAQLRTFWTPPAS